jgi:hypothetical protein
MRRPDDGAVQCTNVKRVVASRFPVSLLLFSLAPTRDIGFDDVKRGQRFGRVLGLRSDRVCSWGALNDGTPILMIVKALDDAGTGNVGKFVFKFSLFVNVIEAHVNGVRVTQDVIAVRACFFRSQMPRHEHVTVLEPSSEHFASAVAMARFWRGVWALQRPDIEQRARRGGAGGRFQSRLRCDADATRGGGRRRY